jgi:DNA-binding response OmpR family regulator
MDVLLRVGAHHVHHQLQQARVQVLDLVRVYIGRLRRKLEDDPASPRSVLTEPGVGYRFAPLQ